MNLRKKTLLFKEALIQFVHTIYDQPHGLIIKVFIDLVEDISRLMVIRVVLHTKINERNSFFMKSRMV